MSEIRINKYLSEVGYCSRRMADKLLEEGRITINGKIPELDFVCQGQGRGAPPRRGAPKPSGRAIRSTPNGPYAFFA